VTDRQVGGEGLDVDIVPQASRQIAAEGLTVDILPPLVGERQVDYLGIQFDYAYPSGVQFGSALIQTDVVPVRPSGWLGAIGLMVDYVASTVSATAARWSGTAFQVGTASPLVYWSSGAFRFSGSTPVNWQTDHFAP